MAWTSGLQLKVVEGKNKGRVVELDHPEVTLGRAVTQSEAAPGWIFFNEPTVSRVHAVLSWQERKKKYLLQHRSKTNPTLVNGAPVDKKLLEPGAKIQMGLLLLVFEKADGTGVRESASQAAPRGGKLGKSVKKPKKEPASVVGPILEALSEVERQRKAADVTVTRRREPEEKKGFGWEPPPSEPEPAAPAPRPTPQPAAAGFLERDFLRDDAQAPVNYRLLVADGPDKGMSFPLDDMVLVIGQRDGFDDPRSGQGILLNDSTLPREQGMLVWQSREGTYGLLSADGTPHPTKVRRVTSGAPRELRVDSERPTLLQEGDVILMGRTALVLRRADRRPGMAPAEPEPARTERPVSPDYQPTRSPVRPTAAQSSAEHPGVPDKTPEPTHSFRSEPQQVFPSSPMVAPPPLEPAAPGGLPPRHDTGFRPQPPPAAPPPRPTPPSEPEVAETIMPGMDEARPRREPVWTRDTVAPGSETLSGRETLTSRAAPRPAPVAPAPPRSAPIQPGLEWPWKRRSDYVFDFLSGPNHGCQIALMESELPEGRTITVGSNGERLNDIIIDSPGVVNRQAVLRYKDKRFTLVNEAQSGTVVVNAVPLKTNDHVVLMTGDRVEMADTAFRFLERKVVEALSQFRLYVESGVAADQDKDFPFPRQRILVGRGKACDVRLSDLEVSRVHVSLVYRDGSFFIAHRSETNPTFLNGISLLPGAERQLNPSDRIRLSSLTVLRFLRKESNRPVRTGTGL